MYKYLFESLFSAILAVYLGGELLSLAFLESVSFNPYSNTPKQIQMGKLRHGVMEPLASHQIAPKWQSLDLNPGNQVPSAQGLSAPVFCPPRPGRAQKPRGCSLRVGRDAEGAVRCPWNASLECLFASFQFSPHFSEPDGAKEIL